MACLTRAEGNQIWNVGARQAVAPTKTMSNVGIPFIQSVRKSHKRFCKTGAEQAILRNKRQTLTNNSSGTISFSKLRMVDGCIDFGSRDLYSYLVTLH